jgi:hypothetical protein
MKFSVKILELVDLRQLFIALVTWIKHSFKVLEVVDLRQIIYTICKMDKI